MFSFRMLHVVTTYLLCGCFSWFLYVVLCGLELAVVRGVPLHCRKDGQSVAIRQSNRLARLFRWQFLAG